MKPYTRFAVRVLSFCLVVLPLLMPHAISATPLRSPGSTPIHVVASTDPCATSWQQTSNRTLGIAGGMLRGITMLSTNNVWAVGMYPTRDPLQNQPLIQRWDGGKWLLSPVPLSQQNGGELNGITAVSPTDIWAVGLEYGGEYPYTKALALHWNGSTWARVATPSIGTIDRLYSVAAVTASDVWAAGESNGIPLLLHWNGSVWQKASLPASTNVIRRLRGITALAANDVWVVGGTSPNGGVIYPYIAHWDGNTWREVNPRSADIDSGELFGVAGTSATDVWTVGSGGVQPMTLHWDGTVWKKVANPPATMGPRYLFSVAAVAADDVWTAGFDSNQSIALHWDGTAWQDVPAPGEHLLAVDARPGLGAFAAGFGQANASTTLTARFQFPRIGFTSPIVQGALGTQATVTVQLSHASPQAVSVDYATEGGTAVAGTDYTQTAGTLTFPPCTTTARFTIPLGAPSDIKPFSTVGLVLRNPNHATTSTASALLVLSDPNRTSAGTQRYIPVTASTRNQGQIVFVSERDGNRELYVMNSDGSSQRRLTNSAGSDVTPSWSPDGLRIAYSSDRSKSSEIVVMNADGSGLVQLTNDSYSDYSPVWSPDGRQIAYTSSRPRPRGDGYYSLVFVVNADGTNPRQLTQPATASLDPGDITPSWSPDGQQLVFATNRAGGVIRQLYIVHTDGSGLRKLTSCLGICEAPQWLPSGRILYTDASPAAGLFTINSDGSDAQAVNANFATGSSGTQSPDGKSVSYSDGSNVYVTLLDGTAPRKLTDSARGNYQPAWSPR